MIKEFTDLLEKMKIIHEKKNKDYAANDNPFENFERSSEIMSWFNDPVDKSFVNLIGTKLARLATLLNSDKEPNNESIDDSFLDLTTYCGLWAAYHARYPIKSDIAKLETIYMCHNCRVQPADKNIFIHIPKPYADNVTYYFCSVSCRQKFSDFSAAINTYNK